jgi:hypothetical protein
MHPRVFGGLDSEPQRFQSLPFVYEVGESISNAMWRDRADSTAFIDLNLSPT